MRTFHDAHKPVSTMKMRDINYCNNRKKQLMSVCDTNAHHVRWKSTGTNRRGESLTEISKTLIYITEFCVFHDLIHFLYGPGQMPKRTMFIDFTPF